MTNKKPTITSLKRDLAASEQRIVELEKKVASTETSKSYYDKRSTEAEAEVESIHSLLDVLPGALARKTVNDPEQAWNVTTHKLMTRFSAFLANRSN